GATMQAALLVLRVFPPPPARANVFAGGHGARARGAADAGISTIVQRVVGNAPRAKGAPNIGVAPVCERVELEQPVHRVALLDRNLPPSDTLRSAQPGDPGTLARERTRQWFGLADTAAAPAELHRAIERVDSIVANVGF